MPECGSYLSVFTLELTIANAETNNMARIPRNASSGVVLSVRSRKIWTPTISAPQHKSTILKGVKFHLAFIVKI